MNRTEKEAAVDAFKTSLEHAQSVILTEFRGLTVIEATKLRAQLRDAGVTLRVFKNTLAKRAIEGTELAILSDSLVGPTAWAFSNEDPVAPAKALCEFIKDKVSAQHLKLTAGYLDGKALTTNEISALAKMPGRDELRSKLLSIFLGQGTAFVRVLSARSVEFLNVLKARQADLESDAA